MAVIVELLTGNQLLLLFLVVAIGYPLGRIRLFGCNIGVAAVLFAGLAFGSLDSEMKLPDIVYILGLVLFVYTIGLSSGPIFIGSFRKDGLRNNLFTAGIILFSFFLAIGFSSSMGFKPTLTAGMFAGGLTNTPALAGILDTVKRITPPARLDEIISEPVIAYSIAYPLGVLGVIAAITIAQRLWKIDYAMEAGRIRGLGTAGMEIAVRTVLVTREEALKDTIYEMYVRNAWDVVFSRIKRGGHSIVAIGDKRLEAGDLVTIVGVEEELEKVTGFLGEESAEHIERDQNELIMRRVFISNREVEGKKVRDLHLDERFGVMLTRLRRGDMDIVVHGNTRLEPGDRVRVVAPRNNMKEVSAFLGDSYRVVSEVDILTFSLGLAIGLCVGLVPIPLPGGVTLKLGFAGGPLIVGLILGAMGRTGPMVWTVPYSANMTLRQIGLILFLAGIGTKAGYGFASTFLNAGGLYIFAAGGIITFSTSMLAIVAGYRLLGIPFGVITGMVAGIHTQPAVLGFALEQTGNDLPNLGYSSVFPTATIIKILLAQILLMG